MRKLSLGLSFLFLLAGALLVSVHLCAENDEMYFSIQERIGLISGNEGLEAEIVKSMNREITGYLAGESERIIGLSGKAFLHMQDVRALLDKAYQASFAAFFLSAACFLLAGKQKTYVRAGAYILFPLMIVVLIPVIRRIDFHGLFIWFHEFAFDNDYWLLDPIEDMLIRILPEAFFSMMAFEIIRLAMKTYLVCGAIVVLLSALLYRRKHIWLTLKERLEKRRH